MESDKGRRGNQIVNWPFDIVSLRSYHQLELMVVPQFQNLVGVAQ